MTDLRSKLEALRGNGVTKSCTVSDTVMYELRERWSDRLRWTRHLREKYECDKTDANWEEYQEMIVQREAAWKEYEAAMQEADRGRA